MDNPLFERINSRLKKLGISPRAASLSATGNPDTIRTIRDGRSLNPRMDTMRNLARVLETSPEWLMTGLGDPDASAAADWLQAEIVENVVYALHRHGALATRNSHDAARAVVELSRWLAGENAATMEDPANAQVFSYEIERLRRGAA